MIPEPWYLRGRRATLAARATLALTCFFDDPRPWASGLAAKLVTRALGLMDCTHPLTFWTSTSSRRFALEPSDLAPLVEMLSVPMLDSRPRHLFEAWLADDPSVPAQGIVYRECDHRRAARFGYLQIRFGRSVPADELVQLAIEMGQTYPIEFFTGGWIAAWNHRYPGWSCAPVYGWAKRFLGMDVLDAEAVSWSLARSLPSTAWMTFLGQPLQERLGIGAVAAELRENRDVRALELSRGLLVVAGDQPSLGDVNVMDFPGGQAHVSRVLSRWLQPMAKLPGPFSEREETDAWARRFVEPESWTG